MKVLLGHDGPPQAFWKENLLTDAPLVRCPLRTIQLAAETDPAAVAEVARMQDEYYPAYVAGYLLEPGGVASQPARYLDFMNAIAENDRTARAKFQAVQKQNQE